MSFCLVFENSTFSPNVLHNTLGIFILRQFCGTNFLDRFADFPYFFFQVCHTSISQHIKMIRQENGLVVRALDSQSRDPRFKTTGWVKG